MQIFKTAKEEIKRHSSGIIGTFLVADGTYLVTVPFLNPSTPFFGTSTTFDTILGAFFVTYGSARIAKAEIAPALARRRSHAALKRMEKDKQKEAESYDIELDRSIFDRIPRETFIKDTNITSEWKLDWSKEMAVRELVQNVRDEKALGYATTFGVSNKGGDLYVWDNGRGAAMDGLVYLGEGDKKNAEGLAGVFGSGLKIAYLVLLRSGINVKVIANDTIIEPKMSKDKNGKEVLTLEIKKLDSAPFKGTCYMVEGAGKMAKLMRSIFVDLAPRDVIAVNEIKSKKSVLTDKLMVERSPKIYVRGIALANLDGNNDYGFNGLFSYDLNGMAPGGKDMMSGEDRIVPNWYRAKRAAARLIANLASKDHIKELLNWINKNPSSFEANVDFDAVSDSPAKKEWVEAIKEIYGGDPVILRDPSQRKEAEYSLPKNPIIELPNIEWEIFFNRCLGIPFYSPRVVEQKTNVEQIGIESLSEQRRQNFDRAAKLFEGIGIKLLPLEGKRPPIKTEFQGVASGLLRAIGVADVLDRNKLRFLSGRFNDVDIVPVGFYTASDDADTEGISYIDRIMIKADILDDPYKTINVIAHEVTHFVDGHGDANPYFAIDLGDRYEEIMRSLGVFSLKRDENGDKDAAESPKDKGTQ